jgi:hypothetical protein
VNTHVTRDMPSLRQSAFGGPLLGPQPWVDVLVRLVMGRHHFPELDVTGASRCPRGLRMRLHHRLVVLREQCPRCGVEIVAML